MITAEHVAQHQTGTWKLSSTRGKKETELVAAIVDTVVGTAKFPRSLRGAASGIYVKYTIHNRSAVL
jgi:hypothetical protein